MTRSTAIVSTKRSVSSHRSGRRSRSSSRRRSSKQLEEEEEDELDDELLEELDDDDDDDDDNFGEDAMDMLSNTFSQLANMTSDFFAGRSMTPTDQQAHVIPDLDDMYQASNASDGHEDDEDDDEDDDDDGSTDGRSYSKKAPVVRARGRSSSSRRHHDESSSRHSNRSIYSSLGSTNSSRQKHGRSSSRTSSRTSSRASSRNSSRASSRSSSRNSSPVQSIQSINSLRRRAAQHEEQRGMSGALNIKKPFATTAGGSVTPATSPGTSNTTSPTTTASSSSVSSRRLSRRVGSGLSSATGEESFYSFMSGTDVATVESTHSSTPLPSPSATRYANATDALIQEKHDKWRRMQQAEAAKRAAPRHHGKKQQHPQQQQQQRRKKKSSNKKSKKKKRKKDRQRALSDANSSTAGAPQVCTSNTPPVRLFQGFLESTTNTCGAMVTGEELSDEEDDSLIDLEDEDDDEERTNTTAPEESLSMGSSFTTDDDMLQEEDDEEDSWSAHNSSYDHQQQQRQQRQESSASQREDQQQQRVRSTTPNSRRGGNSQQQQRQQPAVAVRPVFPAAVNNNHHNKIPLERVFSSGTTSEVSSSFQDKNFIKEFIAQTSQEGLAFTWHQAHRDVPPIEVLVFLEVGYLQASTGCHTGPRLAWYSNAHSLENSPDTLEGALDLLDISHAERGDSQQQQQQYQQYFPYCRLDHAVLLRLPNQALFCLEARNVDEAKRFVHGLRWVVARLAFNLIIGNPVIACELLDIPDGGGGGGGGNNSEPTTMTLYSQEDVAMNDITNELVDKTLVANVAPKLV